MMLRFTTTMPCFALMIRRNGLALAVLAILLSGCASESIAPPSADQAEYLGSGHKAAYNKPYKVKGKTYYPLVSASGYREKGLASWYGAESGNRTASGHRFNPKGFSAAHKTLPIPSTVRVTNLNNGKQLDVVVNDRGPFSDSRLIDLSHGAAKQLGLRGLTEVEVEYIDH